LLKLGRGSGSCFMLSHWRRHSRRQIVTAPVHVRPADEPEVEGSGDLEGGKKFFVGFFLLSRKCLMEWSTHQHAAPQSTHRGCKDVARGEWHAPPPVPLAVSHAPSHTQPRTPFHATTQSFFCFGKKSGDVLAWRALSPSWHRLLLSNLPLTTPARLSPSYLAGYDEHVVGCRPGRPRRAGWPQVSIVGHRSALAHAPFSSRRRQIG
jgi:hypothetical protein